MRTRELIRLKYRANMRGNTRFACRRYFDDTCPHHEDTCDCDRQDGFPDGTPGDDDNCPDFVKVSMRLWQEHLGWEREELEELL